MFKFLSDFKVMSTLKKMSKTDLEGKRTILTKYMASRGEEKTVDDFLSVLNTKNGDIILRSTAAITLSIITNPKIIESLENCLDDSNDSFVADCITALNNLKSKESIPKIIALLYHRSETVYRRAIDCLGWLKAKDALDPIYEILLQTDDEYTKKDSLTAIKRICNENIVHFFEEKELPQEEIIKIFLGVYDWDTLIELGPEGLESVLISLKNVEKEYLRPDIAEVVISKWKDKRIQEALNNSIKACTNPDVVKSLIYVLNNPDKYVRKSRFPSLGQYAQTQAGLKSTIEYHVEFLLQSMAQKGKVWMIQPLNDSISKEYMMTSTNAFIYTLIENISNQSFSTVMMMQNVAANSPKKESQTTSYEMSEEEVLKSFEKQKEILIQSSNPDERVRAMRMLMLHNLKDEKIGDLVITEYIETLKNDWRGELALMSALALANAHQVKDTIISRLKSEFTKMNNRSSTTGRNLQVAICYPLLLMKEKSFFETIKPESFDPTNPPKIDQLIEAGISGDLKKGIELINFYEGIEGMTDQKLYKDVMDSFPEIN